MITTLRLNVHYTLLFPLFYHATIYSTVFQHMQHLYAIWSEPIYQLHTQWTRNAVAKGVVDQNTLWNLYCAKICGYEQGHWFAPWSPFSPSSCWLHNPQFPITIALTIFNCSDTHTTKHQAMVAVVGRRRKCNVDRYYSAPVNLVSSWRRLIDNHAARGKRNQCQRPQLARLPFRVCSKRTVIRMCGAR